MAKRKKKKDKAENTALIVVLCMLAVELVVIALRLYGKITLKIDMTLLCAACLAADVAVAWLLSANAKTEDYDGGWKSR